MKERGNGREEGTGEGGGKREWERKGGGERDTENIPKPTFSCFPEMRGRVGVLMINERKQERFCLTFHRVLPRLL